jgi:hypothetical protein
LEKAEQDCKNRQHEIVDTEVKDLG